MSDSLQNFSSGQMTPLSQISVDEAPSFFGVATPRNSNNEGPKAENNTAGLNKESQDFTPDESKNISKAARQLFPESIPQNNRTQSSSSNPPAGWQKVGREAPKPEPNSGDQSPGGSHRMQVTLNINLFNYALGSKPMYPGLTRPVFCPANDLNFVVGTEEQDPAKKHENCLIFSSLYESGDSLTTRYIHKVEDHVRDIQWIGHQHLVVAINQKLGFMTVNQDLNVVSSMIFPEFHTDTIREICVSANGNLVISGGFDGNVFVTDISKLCSDMQNNESKSENSLYPCKEVVSSVSWHPQDPFLGSCTTDIGILHMFDIRTDKRRPAVVHDTGKKELFTHVYKDGNSMLLGFGDGFIHLFDIRNRRSILSFQDPFQRAIGEIRFDYRTNNFAVFGTPEFTLWGIEKDYFKMWTHHQLSDPHMPMYKTSGDFRKGAHVLGVTDSAGTFSLFNFR